MVDILQFFIPTVGIGVDGGYEMGYYCFGFERARKNVKR